VWIEVNPTTFKQDLTELMEEESSWYLGLLLSLLLLYGSIRRIPHALLQEYGGLCGMMTWINKIFMCLADMVDIIIVWLVYFSCV